MVQKLVLFNSNNSDVSIPISRIFLKLLYKKVDNLTNSLGSYTSD